MSLRNSMAFSSISIGNVRQMAGVLLLLFVVVAGGLSGVRGLSQYFLERAKLLGSDEPALRALRLDTGNTDIYLTRGLTFFDKRSFDDALLNFDRAIELRPYDYRLFIYRGNVRSVLHDAAGAESDYRRSFELAPAYAEPNLHLGRFLLKDKRYSEAFVYLSRAASLDTGLLPEVLDNAFETYPDDAAAFLNAVDPSDLHAKKQTALFLLERGQFAAATGHSLIAGLDEEASRTLVNGLVQKGKFRLAHTLWQTKLRSSQNPGDPENLVVEGDFENLFDLGEAFGWQVINDESQIAISVDGNKGFSGGSGLQIRFLGNSNPNELAIWQLIAVEPGSRYKMTFDASVEKLESGGLPVVVVLDASNHNVVAESKPFSDSNTEWRSYGIVFLAPEETEGIIVGVRRQNCSAGPCPIFGKMLFDNFSLHEVKNQKPRSG